MKKRLETVYAKLVVQEQVRRLELAIKNTNPEKTTTINDLKVKIATLESFLNDQVGTNPLLGNIYTEARKYKEAIIVCVTALAPSEQLKKEKDDLSNRYRNLISLTWLVTLLKKIELEEEHVLELEEIVKNNNENCSDNVEVLLSGLCKESYKEFRRVHQLVFGY